MHRGEAISDPRAEWRRWRRMLSLLALAYGLVALSAVVAGELGSLAWAAAVFGVAVVALALPRSPLGRAGTAFNLGQIRFIDETRLAGSMSGILSW